MTQLSGELSFMPCKDLFLYLGNRRLTGQLAARKGATYKSLTIVEGAAVSAASTDPREYLGQILINSGHLNEDEFNRAYATQLETRVPLGRILTMIGLVKEELVKFALLAKIRETALDVCAWSSGEFAFTLAPASANGGVEMAIPLFDLVREAEVREPIWAELKEALPSGRIMLRLNPAGRAASYSPASLEGRLLPLLEEPKSLDELALHLHATDFQLQQLVHTLIRQELIRPVDPGKPRAAPPPAPPAARGSLADELEDEPLEPPPGAQPLSLEVAAPEDWFPEEEAPLPVDDRGPAALLEGAREALAGGRFEEAEKLAARAVELEASEEALATLKEAEAGLLVRLRDELLSGARVPLVALDRSRLKAMPLSPPERYLLARMDGGRDLASIVRVSPLREIDALKLVKRFLDQQLVTLR